MLCFEKEDIYIVFNLLDSANAQCKLTQIAEFLENFRFKDTLLKTSIFYTYSEYPMDGVSGDEMLANVYRKLQSIKSAWYFSDTLYTTIATITKLGCWSKSISKYGIAALVLLS